MQTVSRSAVGVLMNQDQISDLNAREETPDYDVCAVCRRVEHVCRNGVRRDGDRHEYRPLLGRAQRETNQRGAAMCREALKTEET